MTQTQHFNLDPCGIFYAHALASAEIAGIISTPCKMKRQAAASTPPCFCDSCARIAWYGPPNKCATDICKWHSTPDEVRYSRYLTETVIDESKWNANYPIFGIITLCGVLLWVLFNASWSFYGFSCLVDISSVSSNDSKNIDLGTWSLTYIDSSLGLLICFVPIVVFILLTTLTAAFAVLLGVLPVYSAAHTTAFQTLLKTESLHRPVNVLKALLICAYTFLSLFDLKYVHTWTCSLREEAGLAR